jgi:hypothetical protein
MQRINTHHFFISAAILILVALLTLPAVYGLLKPGFFATHDGEWMIIRFSAFYDALREGQFPVRWLGRLNNMYGYPAPNFAYPLFMYLGVPVHLMGFGVVSTIKIVTGASMVLSGIFTYLWLRKFFRPDASVLGAFMYVYTPYHLYDLYTRGSIGELVALATLPFVLWQIEKRNSFFTAVGTAMLLLSHNILALFFFPFLIVYSVLRSEHLFKNPAFLIRELVPFALGLGMSLFFWIPALYDLQYVIFAETKLAAIGTNFVSLSLFGFINLVILLIGSIFLILQLKKKGSLLFKENEIRILIFFVLAGWIAFFMTHPVSTFMWKLLPATLIQFPFRLLAYLPVVCAFIAAHAVSVSGKFRIPAIAVLGAGILITAIPYLTPKEYFDRGDAYYENNFATTNLSNEYTPRWVEKQIFSIPDAKVITTAGEIQHLVNTSRLTEFSLSTTQSANITINTTYFPGWTIYINNQAIPFAYKNSTGVMTFSLPPGTHAVSASFNETPVRIAADVLSGISFLLLLIWIVYAGELALPLKKKR